MLTHFKPQYIQHKGFDVSALRLNDKDAPFFDLT